MTPFGATAVALGATAGFILLLMVTAAMRPNAPRDVLTAFGCQAVAYLLALFFVLRRYAPEMSIRAFLGFRATHPGFYALGPLLGLATTVPANAVFALLEKRFPTPEPDGLAGLWAEGGLGMRVAIALVLVALGPLLEEVFFRGALFRPLRAARSAFVVVGVTALLFALAHVDFRMVLPIAIVGVALGVLRWYSGSIWPGFTMHATFNAIGLASIAASGSEVDQAIPVAVLVAGSVATVLLVALVPWLGARSRMARAARDQEGGG